MNTRESLERGIFKKKRRAGRGTQNTIENRGGSTDVCTVFHRGSLRRTAHEALASPSRIHGQVAFVSPYVGICFTRQRGGASFILKRQHGQAKRNTYMYRVRLF